MRERILAAIATVLVLIAYAYYGSYGTFRFQLTTWGASYYSGLAEGFLSGHLSMAHPPPPELANVANPYDFKARGDLPVLWDASYFEGKYYLYFSAVPVVLFYVPVRAIAGEYPSDELATTFFAAISFLFFAALLLRARTSLSGAAGSQPAGVPNRRAESPPLHLALWILLIGVGNVIPYVLVASMFYQVAITCAMAFTAAWAYSLLRFLESASARWAVAMGAFLGLAIATRPNLAVLLVVQLLVLIRHRRAIAWVAAPLVVIAIALAGYNYARFRSPFEFGVAYQMARQPMQTGDICGVCGTGEVMRLANHATHYVFWAPVFHGKFPYIAVQKHRLDPEVSYPGGPEPVAGFAPITPLILVGTTFAVMLGSRARAGAYLVLGGWLVLLGLSACWWITARYTLDFVGLLLAGSILCTDAGLAVLGERRLRWICALLAIYSIVIGLLLPFSRGAEFLR